MTQTGVVAGGGRLTDWISLGVLASWMPRDAVDDAIEETGTGASGPAGSCRRMCMTAVEGAEIGGLMCVTGMTRPTIYRHLREHVKAGRVVQVSRGRWRARTTKEPSP
jgi:hypothetical protein